MKWSVYNHIVTDIHLKKNQLDAQFILSIFSQTGAWSSVVVKALRNYSDGPGIDSPWCHWVFH
jgi:hypothetical protein